MDMKDEDKVKPALHEKLTKNQAGIQITRIEKVTDVVEEKIAYQVKEKEDASLDSGKEKIVQKGKEGKLKKAFSCCQRKWKRSFKKAC